MPISPPHNLFIFDGVLYSSEHGGSPATPGESTPARGSCTGLGALSSVRAVPTQQRPSHPHLPNQTLGLEIDH